MRARAQPGPRTGLSPPRDLTSCAVLTISLSGKRGPAGRRGAVITELLPRTDLDQLRRQAKELLHAAQGGDAAAVARVGAVSDRLILTAAQLALAREYGFGSWAALKTEVERRQILDSLDAARLRNSSPTVPSWLPRSSIAGATILAAQPHWATWR